MRQTKKITLSAIMVAMGVVFLALGAIIGVLDLTMAAFSSIIMVLVFIEIGSPYTYLVWLCTTLLSFVFFSFDMAVVTYFTVFGIYPILKAYIERLPRTLWLLIKLVYFNAVMWLLILFAELLTGVPLFTVNEPMWGFDPIWIKAGLYIICNIAFIAYDMFLTVMIRVYFIKFRPRFKKFFK